MEHNQNIDQLRRAFGLTAKEAALVGAMLGGVCDGALLAASCRVASPGALRKQMTRIRVKLPRGGVSSLRRPARYWLSAGAVEICLRALGGSVGSEGFYHGLHGQHGRGCAGGAADAAASARLEHERAAKARSSQPNKSHELERGGSGRLRGTLNAPSARAADCCRRALGGGTGSAGFYHGQHGQRGRVRGAAEAAAAPLASERETAPKAHSRLPSDAQSRPHPVRAVRAVRVQKSLAAHDAAAASQDMPR
jgi:hypothetical protein